MTTCTSKFLLIGYSHHPLFSIAFDKHGSRVQYHLLGFLWFYFTLSFYSPIYSYSNFCLHWLYAFSKYEIYSTQILFETQSINSRLKFRCYVNIDQFPLCSLLTTQSLFWQHIFCCSFFVKTIVCFIKILDPSTYAFIFFSFQIISELISS